MRYMKKLTALALALILLVSATATANASEESVIDSPGILGDIDADGEVTIIDGTAMQFYFAELRQLDESAVLRADTDLDGDNNIVDITHLQRYLAQDDGAFYLGMEMDAAKSAKASDEEAANLRAIREKQEAQEALIAAQAAQDAAAAKTERTRQASAEYRARLKELNQTDIELQIKNYKRQKGVDISEFNGNVDFNKLKAAGYTFVMIRMGWGSNQYSQDDSMFEENVRKAEAAGMPWGAYLYSYALNTTAVQSEVKHTLRLLKGKKPTMPIAFDIEDDDYKYSMGMPSDKTLHDICLTYLRGIEAAGYYPILYTGYSWLTGALNKPDLTGTYDIWYAQWYTKMEYNTPRVGMWQYGGEVNYLESPYISGLSGPYDKDFCFKNYPVIITSYGYNNHPGILDRSLTPTSSLPYDIFTEDGEKLPAEYNGVMGDSFR